jgi:hypothetical protein
MISAVALTGVPKNPYVVIGTWLLTVGVGVVTLVYLYHQIKLNKLELQKHETDLKKHN